MIEFKITRLSPLLTLPYLYPNGTDVLSDNRRLLKNEFLYILSSASVIIVMFPPFLLRLVFFSQCTITAVNHVLDYFEINHSRGIVIQGYATEFKVSSTLYA